MASRPVHVPVGAVRHLHACVGNHRAAALQVIPITALLQPTGLHSPRRRIEIVPRTAHGSPTGAHDPARGIQVIPRSGGFDPSRLPDARSVGVVTNSIDVEHARTQRAFVLRIEIEGLSSGCAPARLPISTYDSALSIVRGDEHGIPRAIDEATGAVPKRHQYVVDHSTAAREHVLASIDRAPTDSHGSGFRIKPITRRSLLVPTGAHGA